MKGIYCIENLINNKKYIGSSQNVYKRRNRHFSELKNVKHKNSHLQNSYNKYGKDNFKFYVIEEVTDVNNLIIREQYYIDSEKNMLYNINLIANSSLGVKRSEETKEKIRQANLGLKHPEWRNKLKSEAQGGDNHWTKNKSFSDESKNKMSESHKKLYENGYVSPVKGREKSDSEIKKHVNAISKPILQYDLEDNFIKEWKNGKETEKGGFNASCVSRCCLGGTKTHKKYKWEFKIKK